MAVRRLIGWSLVLVLALAGCDAKVPWAGGAAGAGDTPFSLLALGDSFSAGEGAPVPGAEDGFLPGTDVKSNRCHRSSEAYAYELYRRLGGDWSLTFRACSGAKLENLGVPITDRALGGTALTRRQWDEPLQTDLGDRRYDLVTMTIGGNDLNFAGILKDCVANGWVNNAVRFTAGRLLQNRFHKNLCQAKHEKLVDAALPALEPKLAEAYRGVKKLTKPGGQVVVLGYPLFFPDDPPGTCRSGAAADFGASDMLWLNSVARRADAAIERAAIAAGVSYVDEHNLFRTGGADHGVCQDDTRGETARWVNRFIAGTGRKGVLPHQAWSFHPTVAAHKAEAGHVLACVRDRSVCDPARRPYTSLEQVLPFPDKFGHPPLGDFGEDPRRLDSDAAVREEAIATRPVGCLLYNGFLTDPATRSVVRANATYPFVVDQGGDGAREIGTLRVHLYRVPGGRREPLRKAITGWPEKCVLRYFRDGRVRTMRTAGLALEPGGEAYRSVFFRWDLPGEIWGGYYSVGYSNGYLLDMTWHLRSDGVRDPGARVRRAVEDTAAVVRREIDGYLPTSFDQR